MATAEAQIGVNKNLQKQDLSNLVSSLKRGPPDAACFFSPPPVCESVRVVIMEPLPGKTAGSVTPGRIRMASRDPQAGFPAASSGFCQGQEPFVVPRKT